MSETEVRDYLERVVEPLSVGPAPVGQVWEAARRRRTRGWVRVGLAGLAAAALIVAAVVVPKLLTDGDPVPVLGSPSGVPDPGPGMRWVGYGRAVVAVPATWVIVTGPCDYPASDYVYAHTKTRRFARCAMHLDPPTQVTVGITSYEEAAGMELTWTLDRTSWVDGVRVLENEPGPAGCGYPAGEPSCHLAFAVPSENAYFALSVTGSECCIDAIRDSLMILPPGYVVDGIDAITPAH